MVSLLQMRVIALKTLREFYQNHPDAKSYLKACYKEADRASWKTPKEIKQTYPNASILSDNRVVFNISGNSYRLVVKFNYKYGWAWIRFIGTHAEYNKINAENI
jgi:mRNA interferase HigB